MCSLRSQGPTEHGFERFRRHPAGPKQRWLGGGKIKHGGFDAKRAATAVKNDRDPVAQIGRDMGRGRRADSA